MMTRKLVKAKLTKVMEVSMENDSLLWYKNYYIHSKHVIGPRIIGRIEEMVNKP